MSAIAHAYAQRTTALTNATTAYADVVSVASGNFTAGKKYLLWCTAQVATNSTSSTHRPNVRVKHGSTAFADSLRFVRPVVANVYSDYHWFHVWTAVSSEAITMEFASGNASGTASIDQATLLAICLSDDVTEGTDWHFDEDGTDLSPLVLATPTAGAEVTFTPGNAGDKWLVASLAQVDANTNTSNSAVSQLDRSGEATATLSSCAVEASNGSHHQDLFLNVGVLTLGNASNTFTEKASTQASANAWIRLHSKVFALNLSMFETAEIAYTAADTADLNATPLEVQTLSVTPATAGPVWVGGFFGIDGNIDIAYTLQVDSADEPATQTADAYTMRRGNDARDEPTYHISSLPTLTAAAHDVDLDVANPPASPGTNTAQYRSLWAVSMELASSGPPPPAITSLDETEGEQGQTLTVVITGTGFVSGATVSFGAGVTVLSTTFGSSTTLTCVVAVTASASTGLRDVTVTNPDTQTDTLDDGFEVIDPVLSLWTDDFNRSDGALGTNWISSGFAIASNAVTSALGAEAYWNLPTNRSIKSPDHYARIRVTLSATDSHFFGIGARCFDGASGYFARIIRKTGTDELEIGIRTGGGTFTRLDHVTHEWTNGDFLEVEVDGNSITARVRDGTTLAEVESVSVTDTTLQEVVGTPTLYASHTGSTIDDFDAGLLRVENLSHVTVGAATDTTARIAFAVTHACTVKVRYATSKSAGALVSPTTTSGVAVNGTTDNTGKIDITGLSANTVYHFEVLIDDVSHHRDTSALEFPKFTTAPATSYSGQFKIAFGSCFNGNGTVMNAVANKAPHLWLLNGDIVYTEDFGGGPSTLAEYRHIYRIAEQSGNRGVYGGTLNHVRRRTRREFASIYQRDDHEYYAGSLTDTKQALLEHLLRGNPDCTTPGDLYYNLRFGPVELFVLDTRSHRTASVFLGATQEAWLHAALQASTATFKIITTGGPVMGYASADSWAVDSDYRAERDDLFDLIETEEITGVMFWTGDRHITGAYLNKRYTAGVAGAYNHYEFLSSPVDSADYPVPSDAQTVRPIAQSGATRTSNVATINTGLVGGAVAHGIVVGETVVVSGVSDASFDGTHVVTAVTTTSVSYENTGSNVGAAAAGGGYIESQHILWQKGGIEQQFAVATFDTSVTPPTISISSYDETGTLLSARTPGGGSDDATLELTMVDLNGAVTFNPVWARGANTVIGASA
jgi:phosphodiesterase/alkaline phosphatase D-like protein